MSVSVQRSEGLAQVLGGVRKELLDFSLRNPLLNYRLLKTRGLEVIGEHPPSVHRVLAVEGKQFSFQPLEESGDATDEDEILAYATGVGGRTKDSVRRSTNAYLPTSLAAKQLQSRLLATYSAARTSLDEQGVNTLFLALGMLHWRESESSEETHDAPLILVPVELEPSDARHKFRLKATGDDLEGKSSAWRIPQTELRDSIP